MRAHLELHGRFTDRENTPSPALLYDRSARTVDLTVTWSPMHWLVLLAEADALFPGDFFPGRATLTKVVVGADLVWP